MEREKRKRKKREKAWRIKRRTARRVNIKIRHKRDENKLRRKLQKKI